MRDQPDNTNEMDWVRKPLRRGEAVLLLPDSTDLTPEIEQALDQLAQALGAEAVTGYDAQTEEVAGYTIWRVNVDRDEAKIVRPGYCVCKNGGLWA
jgi:hypothetical protein